MELELAAKRLQPQSPGICVELKEMYGLSSGVSGMTHSLAHILLGTLEMSLVR